MIRTLAGGLSLALLALAGTPTWAQHPSTHEHAFSGAERWAHVFDDPARDAWQKPHEVIRALALPPDAVVADVGSGTGYFAVRMATMLPQGRVYGVDIEPDMVRYLADRAQRERRDNVVSIAGAPDDPRLPEKVDLVLMVDVLHHIDRPEAYLERLRGVLKPGGRVAIIDFRLDADLGPPKAARLPPTRVKALFASAGYRVASEYRFLPKQYFIVFAPSR